MPQHTLLRNVRPWGGPSSDVLVDDTKIVRVAEPGVLEAPGAAVVDGRGGILLPSFSDVHVHLDSTRIGLPFRPHSAGPGLWDKIMDDRLNWRTAGASVADRATATLGAMIEKGVTRVRSHAQVDADSGLTKFEGVLATREAHRERADVEVVVFPQVGIFVEDGVVELLDEALSIGGDLIGGIDPCTIDRDPVRHLDTVFALAEKHQVGIDIHLHEPGPLGLFSLDLITERVRAHSMHGRVTISHAMSLTQGGGPGTARPAAIAAAIADLADAEIAVTNVAPAGSPIPLVDLTAAGVRVGLGEDGQRDYWGPWGDGDMLERAYLLAYTNNFREDPLVEHALAVATWGGASVMDTSLPRLDTVETRRGTFVGDPSELVIVRGDTPTAAVMDRDTDRIVVHRGRVVAAGGVLA